MMIRNLIICCGTLLLSWGTCEGCSCIERTPISSIFNQVDAVFSGTITAIDTVDSRFHGSPEKEASLVLTGSWKGPDSLEAVRTALDGAACGYVFNVGIEYLIYASFHDDYADGVGRYSTTFCVPTQPMTFAAQHEIDFWSAGPGEERPKYKADFMDFLGFAEAYKTTNPLYDLNGNGQVDVGDFFFIFKDLFLVPLE